MSVYICLKFLISLKFQVCIFSLRPYFLYLKMVVYQLPPPCEAGVRRSGCSSSVCLLAHCHGSWPQKPPSFLLWFPVKKMICHVPVYIGPIWLVHAQIWWLFGGDLHDECQLSSRRLSVSVFPVPGSLTAPTCSTAVPWRWPHLIYRTWGRVQMSNQCPAPGLCACHPSH